MIKKNRLKIGIIFKFSPKWLGGVYYILNIIKSLNSLGEEDKPIIILFHTEELSKFVEEINYPYLTIVPWNFTSINKGYIKSLFSRKNFFAKEIIDCYPDLDGLYPLNDHPVSAYKSFKNNIVVPAWYADLQHKFYPRFFTKKQLLLREGRLWFISRNAKTLVVSSNDVSNHFNKFYKLNKSIDVKVLHFISIIDNFNFISRKMIEKKYNLPKKYFIVSNQFHPHKNHEVLWKAVKYLKDSQENVNILVTGRVRSKGNDKYIKYLLDFRKQYQLENEIRLLDTIPRQDQLSLMKYSLAVIQPSLFEGWSTVIEDAKSIQVPVIASDLDVNKEQLGDKGYYFDRFDEVALGKMILKFQNDLVSIPNELYLPYEERIQKFAREFIDIFKKK